MNTSPRFLVAFLLLLFAAAPGALAEPPVVSMSATEASRAYFADFRAFNARYYQKSLSITGVVKSARSIGSDTDSVSAIVTLVADAGQVDQASFGFAGAARAAALALKPGQTVTIQGEWGGKPADARLPYISMPDCVVVPAQPTAPPAPPIAAAATRHFTSSRAAYEGVLAARYVDFSFDYPTSAGWALQQGAELRAAEAYAQVSHKEKPADQTAIEGFVVSRFASNLDQPIAELLGVLGPQMMAQINANNARSYPNYRKVSEGRVKFGLYDAYELRGAARVTSGQYANNDIWIRVVAVAPSDGGRNGLVLLFLSSPRAGVQSVSDVGSKGDLAIIANSFRLGR